MRPAVALLSMSSILGLSSALWIPPATEGPCVLPTFPGGIPLPLSPPLSPPFLPPPLLPPVLFNDTHYGEVLNEVEGGAELNSGANNIYKREHHNGTKLHFGKHTRKKEEESKPTKKFCYEGKTYDDIGVSAWVRRSKISFISTMAHNSVSMKMGEI